MKLRPSPADSLRGPPRAAKRSFASTARGALTDSSKILERLDDTLIRRRTRHHLHLPIDVVLRENHNLWVIRRSPPGGGIDDGRFGIHGMRGTATAPESSVQHATTAATLSRASRSSAFVMSVRTDIVG